MTQTTNSTAHPATHDTPLDEVRYHLAARDGESALTVLKEIPKPDGESAEAELLRTRAHILEADADEAVRSLRRAGQAGATAEQAGPLYQEIVGLGQKLDPTPHARFLTWYVDQVEDLDLALTLLRLQIRRRRPKLAGNAARRVLALDPGNALAYRLAYVAALRSDTPQDAIGVIRDALEHAREDPRFPSLKSTMMGLPSAQARTLMAELQDRWPLSLSSGANTGDLQTEEDNGPALASRKAYFAAVEGDLEAAAAHAREARDLAGDRPLPVREQVMDEVIAAIPGPDEHQRPLVVDEGREVTRSGPSLSGVTLLVLTNLSHRMNYDHEVLDAFCAAEGAAAIYLRDYSYRLFIGGVAELGPDRASTIAALREELKALGTERLVVMGASAGAYSAPSYGRELGAAHIIGLGTPTTIGRFNSGGDTRVKTLISKLNAGFPPEDLDLRLVLPRIGGDAPIDLWYGADRDLDRAHAEDIAHLPGVRLHPLAGHSDHQILPKLVADGSFRYWLQP